MPERKISRTEMKNILFGFMSSEVSKRKAIIDTFKECIKRITEGEREPYMYPIEWYETNIAIREPELKMLSLLFEFVQNEIK